MSDANHDHEASETSETTETSEELAESDLEIPQVAQSEHSILSVARALIAGPARHGDLWHLLAGARPVAPKIGPTCAALLEDTLGRAWHALWLRDGALPGASLGAHTEPVRRGRLWQRHAVQPLAFTSASVGFLRWLVATPFAAVEAMQPARPAAPLAIGDQLLIYLALDAVRATPSAVSALARQAYVRAAPLAWLGFANALVADGGVPPRFDDLVAGTGAIVVEALRGELAKRWREVELGKRAMIQPDALIALGAAQDAVLGSFMAACDAAHRRDLAAFVLDAAAPLLARDVAPVPATLDANAPLATRMRARVAAGSLLRGVALWAEWDAQHRGVRFIDDDYAAAQWLLERFETIGAAGAARAKHWLAELASLTGGAAMSGGESPGLERGIE